MKIKLFFGVLAILFLASCSSSRRVTVNKKKQKVTVVEHKTKLPSVQQIQHVRKLTEVLFLYCSLEMNSNFIPCAAAFLKVALAASVL